MARQNGSRMQRRCGEMLVLEMEEGVAVNRVVRIQVNATPTAALVLGKLVLLGQIPFKPILSLELRARTSTKQ